MRTVQQAGAHPLLCEAEGVRVSCGRTLLSSPGEMVLLGGVLFQKHLFSYSLGHPRLSDKEMICGDWNSKVRRSQDMSLEQGAGTLVYKRPNSKYFWLTSDHGTHSLCSNYSALPL